jgi:hypothetical protein
MTTLTIDEFARDFDLIKQTFYDKLTECERICFNNSNQMMQVIGLFEIVYDKANYYLCVRFKSNEKIRKLFPDNDCPFMDDLHTHVQDECDDFVKYYEMWKLYSYYLFKINGDDENENYKYNLKPIVHHKLISVESHHKQIILGYLELINRYT